MRGAVKCQDCKVPDHKTRASCPLYDTHGLCTQGRGHRCTRLPTSPSQPSQPTHPPSKLPSMTLLPSLYMSMLSTTLSGMKDWILAEKAVLPDPEGPARPTRMVSRFWEQSSWMARTTMKDPFSKLSRPSRGLMVYRERPSPDLYFTSSSWSFSKAWGIRGAGAAWDGALQGNAGWCGTGRHSAQQQLLCAAFLHIITFFSRDMGVRASPARDPFRTMSMAGSNSKYEIASEE